MHRPKVLASRRHLATVAVALVGLAAATTFVVNRGGRTDRWAARRAATAIVDPVNRGVVRPVAVVPGRSIAVAGRYVMVDDGTTATVYAQGRPVWRRASVGSVRATPDGSAFVGRIDERVIALDAATGAERWHRAVAGGEGFLVGAHGVVVPRATPDRTGTEAFEVLDPVDGTLRRELPARCPSSALYAAGPIVVGCIRADRIFVYGPEGDEPAWTGERQGSPVVEELGGGRVLVTVDGGRAVFDSVTGTPRFRVPPDVETFFPMVPSGDDRVVTLRRGGQVVQFDASDGHEVSQVTLLGLTELSTGHTPALVGSRVYVFSDALKADGAGPDERRAGVVGWDALTGAVVERSEMGPTSAGPYRGFVGGVGSDVMAIDATLADGAAFPSPHVILLDVVG